MRPAAGGLSGRLGRLRGAAQAAAARRLRPILGEAGWDGLRRAMYAVEEAVGRLAVRWRPGATASSRVGRAVIAPLDDAGWPAFAAYLEAHGQSVDFVRRLGGVPGARVLVASADDRPLGHVILVPRPPVPDGRAAVKLLNFHVTPALRGRGLGRRLLAAFEREASAQGAAVIRLLANPGDGRAMGFYERAGFRPVPAPEPAPGRGRVALEAEVGRIL